MSNLRAQFKLPDQLRSILEVNGFYYFGGYMARRDMTPVGFDRALPTVAVNNNRIGFSMKGCGAVAHRGSDPESVFSAGSAFASSGLVGEDPVFESKSGPTVGQKFTAYAGRIYQVLDSGELQERYQIQPDNMVFSASYLYTHIVGETSEFLFVLYMTNDSYHVSYSQQRSRITRIHKTTGTVIAVPGAINGTAGSTHPSYDGSVAPTHQYSGNMVNRAWSLLRRQDDGRQVYVSYTTNIHGVAASVGPNQPYVRYGVLDVDASRFDGSQSYKSEAAGRTYSGIPSGLLEIERPEELASAGVWYLPDPTAGTEYKIRMFDLPRNIPTTAAEVNAIRMVPVECEVTGLPEGMSLANPVAHTASARAQISSWLLKDGNKNYLVTYAHSNARVADDSNAACPPSGHVLVVLEINPADPSKLSYVSHHADAFGYGVTLPQFVRSADARTLVVASATSFGILTWNSTARAYMASPIRGINGGINRMHLDSFGQVWVESTTGEVSVFNIALSATVQVSFRGNPSGLLYTGETIRQEALVDSFNFSGTRIARAVRLVAIGCTFEDGSVQKTITTSATEQTVIPVFITGGGDVTVDAFPV